MDQIAQIFIVIGILFLIIGIILYFGGNFLKLGKLPGDIVIKKENFSIYIPITTSIIISAILIIIFLIIRLLK